MVYAGCKGVAGEWEEREDGGLGVNGVAELGDCGVRSAEVVEPECMLDDGGSGGERKGRIALLSHPTIH